MEQGYVKSIGTIHVQGGNVFIELEEALSWRAGRTGLDFRTSMYSGGLVVFDKNEEARKVLWTPTL